MSTTRAQLSSISPGLVLACLLLGCHSPLSESSTQEGTVSGIVRVRGKPVAGGALHFNASNPNRKVETRDAPISKDGRYTLRAYIGLNIVTITPPKARNSMQKKEFFGVGYDEKPVQVGTGDNTIDLDFLAP